MSDPRCLLILATYNEAENLPALVQEIRKRLPALPILVIDDDSPDGTPQVCVGLAATDCCLRCLIRKHDRGLGSATLTGLQAAIDEDFDFVATMDVDFSHAPESLTAILQTIERNEHLDVVIGSRYVTGGAIDGWPAHRRLVSRTVNWMVRNLAGVPARDCTGAFRVYRVSRLRQIGLGHIRSTGFGYLEEILFALHQTGARFAEVPIVFRDRTAGSSKATFLVGLSVLQTVTRLTWMRLFGKTER